MIILAIETSCDETAAAVIQAEKDKVEVLSNVVSSQIKLHAAWGGVVPNLAAREHLKNIVPVIKTSLKEASLTQEKIDLLAVTEGPGLIPALLIGVNAAKTLAYTWQKPLLGIHHIEGHIYANFINEIRAIPKDQKPKTKNIPEFPILCLVVSGGHTQLVYIKNHLDYKIIGETLDDAAGEAFDKVARILKLGYPGGPAVSLMAEKQKSLPSSWQINFPRPMLNKDNFDFSFSGLKTSVLYETKKNESLIKNKKYISAICREFQQAVVDVLITKTLKAAEKLKPKTIILAGGVSANKELRKQLGEAIQDKFPKIKYQVPVLQYSVDNAAMIATAAYFRWKNMTEAKRKTAKNNWQMIVANAGLKMTN
jgi:N6-L-threonylcarbamoyladenine synthase